MTANGRHGLASLAPLLNTSPCRRAIVPAQRTRRADSVVVAGAEARYSSGRHLSAARPWYALSRIAQARIRRSHTMPSLKIIRSLQGFIAAAASFLPHWSSAWLKACVLVLVCAVAPLMSSAQNFKSLVNFDGTNGFSPFDVSLI